jgi:hypothetical protein
MTAARRNFEMLGNAAPLWDDGAMTIRRLKPVAYWTLAGMAGGAVVVLVFAAIVRLTEGNVSGIVAALILGIGVGSAIGLVVGVLSVEDEDPRQA